MIGATMSMIARGLGRAPTVCREVKANGFQDQYRPAEVRPGGQCPSRPKPTKLAPTRPVRPG